MVAQQKVKDNSVDSVGAQVSSTAATNGNPGSPKSRLAMLKRSSARTKTNAAASSDPFRFQGNGVDFKGKLIGEREVNEARGDVMCAEAMRLAKANVKSTGSHKLRIILNISIEGLKIKDEKSGSILYNFPVSKISFIARDTTDARAFGFIFGTSDAKYKFYGIKTAQTADHAVLSIRDMFQVVFEMKKKQIQEVKQKKEEQENLENFQRESSVGANGESNNQNMAANNNNGAGADCRIEGGVAVADLLDLETELECLEQGFNQLQNIPHMPEDDCSFDVQWNSNNNGNGGFGNSGGIATTNDNGLTKDPFNDSFFNSTNNSTTNGHFGSNGTNGLNNLHSAVLWPSTTMTGQPAPANGNSAFHNGFQSNQHQQISAAVYSGTNPFANLPPVNAHHAYNGFGNMVGNGTATQAADPFDTQSAHRVINALNNVHSYGPLPPPLSLQQQQPAIPLRTTPPSAPLFASAPMATGVALLSAPLAPPVVAPRPFGGSAPTSTNNFNGFANNAPSNGHINNNNNNDDLVWGGGSSLTSKENKAPVSAADFVSAFESDKSTKWNESNGSGPRVTTLEEAFSKLVDMDQLVPASNNSHGADMGVGAKKNPFEHIINPPKMPLNALLTTSHFQ